MSQETRVFQVDEPRARQLERAVAEAGFGFREVPHARWAGKGRGVVATCYRSGKLVVQGAGADVEAFTLEFLGGHSQETRGKDPEIDVPDDVTVIGADEAGKGDYFGPLVVAAVYLDAESARAMRDAGAVRDSKKLSTTRILQLAGALERSVPTRITSCRPSEYNERYAAIGNLNDLLADLHAENLQELARVHSPAVVVVDQFGRESYLGDRLRGSTYRLVQVHRGERHVAVAAASILARAHYLEALRELSDRHDIELRPGSGEPTMRIARQLVRREGPGILDAIAKTHFKITDDLLAGLEELG